MPKLRLNTKTNQTSWGFDDGNLFYPFGNNELAKAMATLLEMEFKTKGFISDVAGESLGEWREV